jgi:ArsR family transcriptional regulator
MNNDYTNYALQFKALSDETRLKIISMLTTKELCACKILEAFNITQPTLSYHMKILVDTNLVTARKDGSWVKYALKEENYQELMEFMMILFNKKGVNS